MKFCTFLISSCPPPLSLIYFYMILTSKYIMRVSGTRSKIVPHPRFCQNKKTEREIFYFSLHQIFGHSALLSMYILTTDKEPDESWDISGHALGIWICGCRLFCKGGSKGGYRGGSIRLKSELGIFYSSQR